MDFTICNTTQMPEDKQSELAYKLRFKKIDATVTICKAIAKYACILGSVYFVYRSVAALAGKQTFASVGLSILGNIKVSEGIYIVLTSGGIIFGVGQMQLRRRNIERLTKHSIALEKQLDPKRTSSGLTKRGTTRPEDQT